MLSILEIEKFIGLSRKILSVPQVDEALASFSEPVPASLPSAEQDSPIAAPIP